MNLISPNFKDLLKPNMALGQFPDGDIHIRIPNLSNLTGHPVTVFHRLYPNQNQSLLELLLILEGLRRKKCHITVVSPYLPYARQDKSIIQGEFTNALSVCNLLHQAGCKKLITFDCHFLNTEGFNSYGNLKILNISMGKDLINYAEQFFKNESFEIISPDQGSNYLVKHYNGSSFQKTRKGYINKTISNREIDSLNGTVNLTGQNVLLIDDMVSTGATMIKAIKKIRKAGAKKIVCAAVHGLFLGNSLKQLQKLAYKVYSTDTILNSTTKLSIKPYLKNVR